MTARGRRVCAFAAAASAWMLAVALPARADETSFASANEAYLAGDYATAVRRYEALVAAGIRHEDLFYNLGNAYFRLAADRDDVLGRAIYNYERALRVRPDFDDAAYNLQVARDAVAAKVVDRIESAEGDPLWVTVATKFSIGQLTVAFLVVDAVLFAALIALRLMASGFARAIVAVGAGFAAVAFFVAAALLWAHVYFVTRVDLGIVLPDETQLSEAPGQTARDGARLHAGLRVHVVDREGSGWVRVRLANGHEGWLPAEEVGEL
ncbi:MAG: hypothetical protein D6689_14180 [Deltaproteobacteria bacterium]|nr:MAG: hypothetical protein D6689_14180 [Deltaproteobacteria bacterium]